MSNNVVSFTFTTRLKNKQDRSKLAEVIEDSGWTIDSEIGSVESDVCVYLIDSKEPGIVLFGCKKDEFAKPGTKDIIHWGHFVLAWDVIADPSMAFDATHKKNAIGFVLRALPGLPQWHSIKDRTFKFRSEETSHMLIIIDRENMDCPLDVIVAHSKAPIMDQESIQSIIFNYLNAT